MTNTGDKETNEKSKVNGWLITVVLVALIGGFGLIQPDGNLTGHAIGPEEVAGGCGGGYEATGDDGLVGVTEIGEDIVANTEMVEADTKSEATVPVMTLDQALEFAQEEGRATWILELANQLIALRKEAQVVLVDPEFAAKVQTLSENRHRVIREQFGGKLLMLSEPELEKVTGMMNGIQLLPQEDVESLELKRDYYKTLLVPAELHSLIWVQKNLFDHDLRLGDSNSEPIPAPSDPIGMEGLEVEPKILPSREVKGGSDATDTQPVYDQD
ncbi:MAG: hypothetical protein VYA34_07690 [Myxococcota bacterium]|nr:hypothetical protein [Myxococcota bacterium]